jgi:glyoxylase I family protein
VAIIRSGDLALELFKATAERPDKAPAEAGPMYPCWRHVCFVVDDLEAKLMELGNEVTITLGPLDMSQFVPGMKVVWVADPEGNIIELNQGYVDEPHPPAV